MGSGGEIFERDGETEGILLSIHLLHNIFPVIGVLFLKKIIINKFIRSLSLSLSPPEPVLWSLQPQLGLEYINRLLDIIFILFFQPIGVSREGEREHIGGVERGRKKQMGRVKQIYLYKPYFSYFSFCPILLLLFFSHLTTRLSPCLDT